MKRLLFVFALLFVFTPALAQGKIVDCTPENVREWMIQRQVGRNQLQPFYRGDVVNLAEYLFLAQQARRDLEDLDRPDCANELYELTVFLYDTTADWMAAGISMHFDWGYATEAEQEALWDRMDYYFDNSLPLYEELQEIAGIDVMAVVAEIQPVATVITSATSVSPPSIESTTDGTITMQGSGSYVFDPMGVPSGLYRVTFTTLDFGVAGVEELSGDCGFLNLSTSINGGTEQTTFRSDNCRGVITVEHTAADWTLIFEPLIDQEPTQIPTSTPNEAPIPTNIPTQRAISAQVEIVEMVGVGDIASEGVVIQNNGSTVDVSGWTLSDSDGNTYVFPEGRRLFRGASITVNSRNGENTAILFFWGRVSAVYGDSDDEVVTLSNRDGEVQASFRLSGE